MATPKLKTDPVTATHLAEFINNESDFGFEIEVLRRLIERGYSCEHGGTYVDRATKKPRQFDIRATQEFGVGVLRLAVECKNVRPNFPLLVSCMPRRLEEAFHEIVISSDPAKFSLEPRNHVTDLLGRVCSKSWRLERQNSTYQANEPVGKRCEQVGIRQNGDGFASTDSSIYDKWAQALSSAYDLADRACHEFQNLAAC